MKYSENREYINEHAYKFALLGASNHRIASLFGVAETTFEGWMQKNKALREAVDKGRDFADADVGHALFQRATGRWKQKAVKIMQYQGEEVIVPYTERFAPDVGAAQYWLNNRTKARKARKDLEWSSRTSSEVSGPNGEPVKVTRIEHVIVDPKT